MRSAAARISSALASGVWASLTRPDHTHSDAGPILAVRTEPPTAALSSDRISRRIDSKRGDRDAVDHRLTDLQHGGHRPGDGLALAAGGARGAQPPFHGPPARLAQAPLIGAQQVESVAVAHQPGGPAAQCPRFPDPVVVTLEPRIWRHRRAVVGFVPAGAGCLLTWAALDKVELVGPGLHLHRDDLVGPDPQRPRQRHDGHDNPRPARRTDPLVSSAGCESIAGEPMRPGRMGKDHRGGAAATPSPSRCCRPRRRTSVDRRTRRAGARRGPPAGR